MSEYDSLNHAKYKIRYHIIFSTRYRKNLLAGKIADDVKISMLRASKNQGWSIEIQEIDNDKPNHIHLLIKTNPTISPSQIVHRLKQFSTYDIWRKHYSEMRLYYLSGKHYLWTRGYFCSSIGDACTDTIYKYIKNQG